MLPHSSHLHHTPSGQLLCNRRCQDVPLGCLAVSAALLLLWSAVFIGVPLTESWRWHKWSYIGPTVVAHVVALCFALLQLITAAGLLRFEEADPQAAQGGNKVWRFTRVCCGPRHFVLVPAILKCLVLFNTLGLVVAATILMSSGRWYSYVGALLCVVCALVGLVFICLKLLNKLVAVTSEERSLVDPRIDALSEQLRAMAQQQTVLVEMMQAQQAGVGPVLAAQGTADHALPPKSTRGRARVDPVGADP